MQNLRLVLIGEILIGEIFKFEIKIVAIYIIPIFNTVHKKLKID